MVAIGMMSERKTFSVDEALMRFNVGDNMLLDSLKAAFRADGVRDCQHQLAGPVWGCSSSDH